MIKTILLLIIFILGIYFCLFDVSKKEGLTSREINKCPNLLIQKGCKLYLQNTKMPTVPGVNPIIFENLEQYKKYIYWQRSKGVNCPILFLQHTYDAQGDDVYKVQSSPLSPQGGLPPAYTTNTNTNTNTQTNTSQNNSPMNIPLADPNYKQYTPLINAEVDNPPYNSNMYPAFDPTSFYIGKKTPLDKINEKQESLLYSDSAMDPNWGGIEYTRNSIKEGKYKGDEVSIWVG